MLTQRHLLILRHCCSIHNAGERSQPWCPPAEERITKMWDNRNFASAKKNEICKYMDEAGENNFIP